MALGNFKPSLSGSLTNGHALKPQRRLRPIVGQTQESLSLLFGPSPGGPPEAISCVFVIFIDRGMAPPQFSGSATGLSATDARRQSPGWWFEHHAPLGLRIASQIATHARPVEGAVAPRSRLFINREDVYGLIVASPFPSEGIGPVGRPSAPLRRGFSSGLAFPRANYLPAMSSLSSHIRSVPSGFIEPCLPSPADKPPLGAKSLLQPIRSCLLL